MTTPIEPASDRPTLTPMHQSETDPAWKQVINLFERHGQYELPHKLRDEIVALAVWAWYGQKLDAALSTAGTVKALDYVCGEEYEAGLWSRRNIEAFYRDQNAALAQTAITSDEQIIAGIKAIGEWCLPYTAPRESGVAIDGDITQADADTINAEWVEHYRPFLKAALSAQTAPAEVVGWRYRRSETSDPVMGKHGGDNWQYSKLRPEVHSSQLELWDVEPLYSTPTQAEAREAGIRAEAKFLIDRLDEFAPEINTEHSEREFYGHVEPSIARLRALLTEGEAR